MKTKNSKQQIPEVGSHIWIVYSDYENVREVFTTEEQAINDLDKEQEATGDRGIAIKAQVKDVDIPNTDYELCYCDSQYAYFSDNLSETVGDDWNDVPYEHNAGTPYTRGNINIMRVPYPSNLLLPHEAYNQMNSPWSVLDINDGTVPWLQGENKQFYAGMALTDFLTACALILEEQEVFNG